MNLTNEEHKQIVRAYECLTNERFYSQLFNCNEEIKKGILIIKLYIERNT